MIGDRSPEIQKGILLRSPIIDLRSDYFDKKVKIGFVAEFEVQSTNPQAQQAHHAARRNVADYSDWITQVMQSSSDRLVVNGGLAPGDK